MNALFPSINAQVLVTRILSDGSQFCRVARLGTFTLPFEGDGYLWINILLFVIHCLVLFFLLVSIDSGLIKFSFRNCFSSQQFKEFDSKSIDEDVLAERQRILAKDKFNQSNNNTRNSITTESSKDIDHLIVKDLVKYYPRKHVVAVNHLTFGAKRGECFGLLGYNGAGKTTTFRIIVGEESPTLGTSYIDKQNTRKCIKTTDSIGYCPQQNCDMEFLTVQDCLYLLARIRAIPSEHINNVVSQMASLFLLEPFLKNYIQELSGGTKRRLHAALALIGPPKVAILDEPSTGVDPYSRRQMREVFLNAVKSKLTIILTSHSMDECDTLCNRLGIMVNGQLSCIGNIQHLKSKFGKGYTIDIKINAIYNGTGINEILLYFQRHLRLDAVLKESTLLTGVFQVTNTTPAQLFEILEQNKTQFNIETYSISQSTLEQIFLSFGKHIMDT
ncbi:unnamed protein product [Didymodactylos carnosus]|uniref:ABC transporter domain-containing protein n=2 Tax=Didymodactylos carnosus TaxID=1234261 RepID=A0A8S2F5M6_9BILA|nr:unnamed protein product [Didymodactylos carnosus]CAF4171269.1 unnamed protein product [Didymodactylos carnosus]